MNSKTGKFSTLGSKIIIILLLLSIIPTLVTGTISYNTSRKVLINNLEDTSTQILKK